MINFNVRANSEGNCIFRFFSLSFIEIISGTCITWEMGSFMGLCSNQKLKVRCVSLYTDFQVQVIKDGGQNDSRSNAVQPRSQGLSSKDPGNEVECSLVGYVTFYQWRPQGFCPEEQRLKPKGVI